jgi:hypothetical protein
LLIFENLKIFKAVRMLVQEYFVPHGICAGSEHQGGQHETGTAPVQAAVNFVTTMTVDGKNVDLVNYWFRQSTLAGDELLFRLERQNTTDKPSFEYNLTRYYKDPKVEPVTPPPGAYWQLVPGVVRGDPRADEKLRCTQLNAWRHHLCQGYWRIAQTFQTRKANNIDAFIRGQPLEVTFAPVWQSFLDCRNEDGRSDTYMQSHVTSYQSKKALRAEVTVNGMTWFYDGHKAFTLAMHEDVDKYALSFDSRYCKVHIDTAHFDHASTLNSIHAFPKKALACLHVFFCDAPATLVSKIQPHVHYAKEPAQKFSSSIRPNLNKPNSGTHDQDMFLYQEVSQIPVVNPPIAAGAAYTGEFLLTLTQRQVEAGCSSDFVYAYCKGQPQHYLNFGGEFWTSCDDGEYFNACPHIEVSYENILPNPIVVASTASAPVLRGSGSSAWPDVSRFDGIEVAELPQLHALGAQAPAPAASAESAADAPLLADEAPKKKRTKTLKFFDVSTDGSGRAAE